MTESMSSYLAEVKADEERPHAGEMTEEGRYIPYSGGSMGWFENTGVMKSELGNNYLFHTVMASDSVRDKQFERWGQRFNRRSSRTRVRKNTEVTMTMGKTEVKGSTRDISSHGVRIQFLDDANVQKGDTCKVKLHESEGGPVVVELSARIVWCEKVGKIRPIWNVGMTFTNLSSTQNEKLLPLLSEE